MPIYSSTLTDTTTNKQPYYRMITANKYFTISDNAVMDDIFDDGGTISVWINPNSDGENSVGRVWDKSANSSKGHEGFVQNESSGKMKFGFSQIFSTTTGTWLTPVSLPINEWTNVTVTYDNSNVANNPIIYFNGVPQTLTETTPVGTRVTDDGENLRIGNRTMTNVNFDGLISEFRAYNIELPIADVADLTAGGAVPFIYKGATQTELVGNGVFSADTSWSKGTNWSIGSGVATSAGSNNGAYLSQSFSNHVFGKAYKITYDVSAFTSGYVRILSSGWSSSIQRAATGTYTETIIWNGGDPGLYFQANSDFVGSVDNVKAVRAGAIIELDASSMSHGTWYDKSGNYLDATGTGPPSLENTSFLTNVTRGTAGNITPHGDTALLIEDDSNVALSFLTPNNRNQSIYFGDADDNAHGMIRYDHTNTKLTMGSDGASDTLAINGGAVLIKNNSKTVTIAPNSSDTIYYDQANLGIRANTLINLMPGGTTKLSVASAGTTITGNAHITGLIIGENSSNLYLSTGATNKEISFWDNDGTTRIATLQSDADFCIGPRQPTQSLDVYRASANANIMLESGGTGDDARMYIKRVNSSGRAFNSYVTSGQTWYAGLVRYTDNYSIGVADDYGTSSHLCITATGPKVGIGIQTPLQTLDINGYFKGANSRVDDSEKHMKIMGVPYDSGSTSDIMAMYINGHSGGNHIRIGGGADATSAATTISFNTAPLTTGAYEGTRRLYIAADGKVGINTSTFAADNSSTFSVVGRVSILESTNTSLQISTGSGYAWMEAWDNSSDRSPKHNLCFQPWGGRVGINITVPSTAFSNSTTRIANADGLSTHLSSLNWTADGQGYTAALSNIATGGGNHNGGLLVELGSTHSTDKILDLESGGVNRVRVLGDGSVLVRGQASVGATDTYLAHAWPAYPVCQFQVMSVTANRYAATFRHDGAANTDKGIAIICGPNDASGTTSAINILDGDGSSQGEVTFSGGTITYGAFSANHDAELPDADNNSGYAYGTLVETTEIFYKQKDGADTERGIQYKVQKSQSANSKAVLGAYGNKYSDKDNLHQVLVLGDGHILCKNQGGDIAVGDGICTSSVSGIGMKATTNPSMIIGIAQEAVTFSNGSERKLVAVQYGLQQFTPWT